MDEKKKEKNGWEKEIRTNGYGGEKKKAYGWKGQTCMEGEKEKKKLMDEMKWERTKKKKVKKKLMDEMKWEKREII